MGRLPRGSAVQEDVAEHHDVAMDMNVTGDVDTRQDVTRRSIAAHALRALLLQRDGRCRCGLDLGRRGRGRGGWLEPSRREPPRIDATCHGTASTRLGIELRGPLLRCLRHQGCLDHRAQVVAARGVGAVTRCAALRLVTEAARARSSGGLDLHDGRGGWLDPAGGAAEGAERNQDEGEAVHGGRRLHASSQGRCSRGRPRTGRAPGCCRKLLEGHATAFHTSPATRRGWSPGLRRARRRRRRGARPGRPPGARRRLPVPAPARGLRSWPPGPAGLLAHSPGRALRLLAGPTASSRGPSPRRGG